LHPDIAEHFWHTEIQPFRSFIWRGKDRAALQPFPWKRDRTDRAPAASEEGDRDENEDRPPRDPNKDNAEVVTADRRSDESRKDGKDVTDQHDDKDCQLRVTAFESVLYKRDTGKFDAVHVRKQYFF